MNNRTIATAAATLGLVVDWDKYEHLAQPVIDAAKSGMLQLALEEFMSSQAWNTGKFVVRKHFVIDTSRKAKVKISGRGGNFDNWFLNSVEELPRPVRLDTFVLPEYMLDKDIIAKLGGAAKAITSLGDMFGRMQEQPEGPGSASGQLLTNGYANIFFVPQAVMKLEGNRFGYVGIDGKTITEEVKDAQYLFEVGGHWCVLRAVSVSWGDDGWYVSASFVADPFRWLDGYPAFSRNSVLKPLETSTAVS